MIAIDKDVTRRPGVPMMTKPSAERTGGAPIPQQAGVPSSGVGVEVGSVTPVFGTAVPLKGISGIMRKLAYKIPEHSPGRWLTLMMADKVDVQESRIRRHPFMVVGILGGVAAGVVVATRARRK